MKPDQIEPGTFVVPSDHNPWPVAGPVRPEEGAQPLLVDRDGQHRVPMLNLLQRVKLAPTVAVEGPVAAKKPARKHSLLPLWTVLVSLIVIGGGSASYIVLARKPTKAAVTRPVVVSGASATTPPPVPSPPPSPTPSTTPSIAPSPTPLTVSGLTGTPTASDPQSVTVTSPNGLWLRSSPTSVNRSNIISWMPLDSHVTVDSVGNFWWHGSFKGMTGYFASKYTQ
jgi:hypothetical protein